MKILRTIFASTLVLALSALLLLPVSCELLDYDLQGLPAQAAASMHLEPDTIYVMVGDRFVLTPRFDPDTVNITDLYVEASADSLVKITPDSIEAVAAGWTKLYVQSVSSRIADTCTVCIMNPWKVERDVYPYETIIYARLTLRGEPLPDSLLVAAFNNETVCGMAQVHHVREQTLWVFRAGSVDLYTGDDIIFDDEPEEEEQPDTLDIEDEYEDEDEYEEDNDEENKEEEPAVDYGEDAPWTVQTEYVVIRAYDHFRKQRYTSRVRIPFDGESHGTPSNPIVIDLR